jgi:hypothetical protein
MTLPELEPSMHDYSAVSSHLRSARFTLVVQMIATALADAYRPRRQPKPRDVNRTTIKGVQG